MINVSVRAIITAGLISFGTIAQAQHLDSVAPKAFFDEEKIKDISYGLVCPSGKTVKLPAPDTHLGFITQRDKSQRIEHTTQIVPLSKGIGFGVDVKLPWGAKLRDVEIAVIHPPYPGTDVTQEHWNTELKPRGSNLNFFLFEFPHEMIAGDWTLQASHQGRIIYSVTFKAVDPSRVHNLSGLCSGKLLS
ncbi:DUF3859 domain-containing protein [uncultured Litoreibacter sp.]|uniref:DUF3859 domain-containing protein n=1 Tax=uncultured Litoreibacter sp. TaxID=1392394 RepID=UPI002627776E|nr:DUF3859 domain-containing protein [uncultured Litoreibacter sp.]